VQRAGLPGRHDAAPSMDEIATATIATRGAGAPLDAAVRGQIEPVLGAALGHVRVHSDDAAHTGTAGVHARAFTHGSDIFLGRNESAHDVKLMAHEATHVVQQGTQSPGVQRLARVGATDDPAEREADAVAERVVTGGPAAPVTRAPASSGVVRRTENPGTEGTDAAGKAVEEQTGDAFIKGAGDADEISPNDVQQGQLGDCWLMAGLMAVAKSNPDAIRNMIKPAGPGKWTVTFYFPDYVLFIRNGFRQESVTVDAKVPVVAPGGSPLFAKVGDTDGARKELWVLLVEKAYAKTQGKYSAITGSNAPSSHQSMEMITGKSDSTLDPSSESEDDLLTKLSAALTAKRGVQCWSIKKDHDKAPLADSHTPKIVTNHGYVLDGVDPAGRTVTLLNPWGPAYTITGLPIADLKKFYREIRIGG
jgi:hypothetical protein